MGTTATQMLKEDDLGPADKALLDLLNEGRVTAPFAAEETGYSLQYVRDRLSRLVEHGNAAKVYEGLYELTNDPRRAAEQHPPEPTDAPREAPTPSHETEETPEPESGHLPEEIDADVWAVVDDVAEGWDEDSRLENRRQAAALVLQHAVNTGEAVGKSHPVVDHVIAEYPVEGQNKETYWRKNVRDVLAEVGDYSRGKHGYTVKEGL